ncbi:MAG: tRNA pseudouridine(38-40) synthase TruA [Aureispira sp.]
MRYFLELAYNGTRYSGYQEQPHQVTIQGALEDALQLLLQIPTKVVGCGRTDAGVHALQYFVHFDVEKVLSSNFLYRLNRVIGNDILCYRIVAVAADAHARFDAVSRSYRYVIDLYQNPFRQETAHYCHYGNQLDIEAMQQAAQVLLQYKDFTTFCKSKTQTKTNLCTMYESYWETNQQEQQLIYHVRANRFLRGMIRLIVGMCLNVGRGKTSLAQVQEALEQKKTLQQALSAPAQGLFLTDIRYEYITPRLSIL